MSQELSLQLVRAAQSAGYLVYTDTDPTLIGNAINALRGTIAVKRTAPTGIWQKQDDGLTINWTPVNDYATANPANWVGAPPVTDTAALDRMVAVLVALNGGPIP